MFTTPGDRSARVRQLFNFSGTQTRTPSSVIIRETSTANRTYYVSTTGSDSNSGLTSLTPFASVQRAWNVLTAIDLAGYTATIQLADGTYTTALNAAVPVLSGPVVINGNSGTPANVIISTSNGNGAFDFAGPSLVTVQNMEMRNSAAYGIAVSAGARVTIGTGMRFGACSAAHLWVTNLGTLNSSSNYSIVGAAARHIAAIRGAVVEIVVNTITITGTPAFSSQFAYAESGGIMQWFSVTFSGSATGQRYSAVLNGNINTNGGGANYFPGNSAGSTATGGQYA